MTKQPNILFMIADDHQHNALSCRGHATVRTPHLDALAASGTSFTNAHIMGSTDGAVCMPSRGMLMTGRHLFDINAPDLGNHKLLPQVLSEAGYHSYGVGKWHNEPSSYARAFDDGDAIFFGGMCDHDKVPLHGFNPTESYKSEDAIITQGFSTELFANAAIRFLETYQKEDPFCLYVAFTAPHDPRTPPINYRYDLANIVSPENFLTEHPFDNGELDIRDEHLANSPRVPEEIRQHLADYYGMITHLDAEVGRILESLKASGKLENTLIVYTADHGLALGQHGLMGKQNMYEHSLRVPLIMSGARIPKGELRDSLCYMSDLHPTLCDLAHIRVAPSVMTESLVPILTKKDEGRNSLFAAYKNYQRMVKTQNHKLIEYFVNGQKQTQVFDLKKDPFEINNVVKQESYSTQLEYLREEMKTWQERVHDPLLRL